MKKSTKVLLLFLGSLLVSYGSCVALFFQEGRGVEIGAIILFVQLSKMNFFLLIATILTMWKIKLNQFSYVALALSVIGAVLTFILWRSYFHTDENGKPEFFWQTVILFLPPILFAILSQSIAYGNYREQKLKSSNEK